MFSTLLHMCIVRSICRDAHERKQEGTRGRAGQGRQWWPEVSMIDRDWGDRKCIQLAVSRRLGRSWEKEMRAWSVSRRWRHRTTGETQARVVLPEDWSLGNYRLDLLSSVLFACRSFGLRNIFPTRIRQIKYYHPCLWGERKEWKAVRKS